MYELNPWIINDVNWQSEILELKCYLTLYFDFPLTSLGKVVEIVLQPFLELLTIDLFLIRNTKHTLNFHKIWTSTKKYICHIVLLCDGKLLNGLIIDHFEMAKKTFVNSLMKWSLISTFKWFGCFLWHWLSWVLWIPTN